MSSKRSNLFVALVSSILLIVLLAQDGNKQTSVKTATASDSSSAVALYLPAVMKDYDPQFPGSLFGVQTYGDTRTGSKYHSHLVGTQASWVRSLVSWAGVEPEDQEPADYNWSYSDRSLAVASADHGGLHVVAVINDLPMWARLVPERHNGLIRPDAMDDFADFLQATVERYDGDGIEDAPGRPVVRHWEMFNEPDLLETRWGGFGTEYAAMLEVAYRAIKAADPRAQVLLGGLAYDWFKEQGGPFDASFLDDLLAAGGGAYFDVMNFHMYPIYAPVWGSPGTGLAEKTAAIRAKLAQYGVEKPVAITESGWHSSTDATPASSHQEQIARLVQLTVQSYAADVKILIWFMLYDPGNFMNDYGLVTNDSVPVEKPAYAAYQTAEALLANSRFIQVLEPGRTGVPAMEAYHFVNDDGPLYVVWLNPYDSDEVHPFYVPAEAVTVLDGLGNVLRTATDSDGDGLVGVHITAQPVYIQVTSP